MQHPVSRSKIWHIKMLTCSPQVKLVALVGGHAQKWHLGTKESVQIIVSKWWAYSKNMLPLPHPSCYNNAWIKGNKWFEVKLLLYLKSGELEVLK